MNEAMTSFLEIVKAVAPYSVAWGLGTIAYNYVVGAFLGKDVSIR